MIKKILNISRVTKLSSTQQKSISGGTISAGGEDSLCGDTVCSDESEPTWSGTCGEGCMTGICISGMIVYKACQATEF